MLNQYFPILPHSRPPVSLALLSPSRYGPSILPTPALPTSQFLHHHSQVSSLVNSLPHHHPHHPHHAAMHGLANGLSMNLNGVGMPGHNGTPGLSHSGGNGSDRDRDTVVLMNSGSGDSNNNKNASSSSTENLNTTSWTLGEHRFAWKEKISKFTGRLFHRYHYL